MRRNILDQEIEDAVIVEPNVIVEEEHPHFIEVIPMKSHWKN